MPDLGKDKDALLAAITDSMTASPSAPPPRSRRRSSQAATRLKVIGRAGIGVDNVDIPAAIEEAASS